MNRRCECCGEGLVGRSDKRFCNDACRAQHHHLIHQKERIEIAEINRILRTNRRILLEWRSRNSQKAYRENLLQKGFSFNYYTHIKVHGNKMIYYCYDLGYQEEGKGSYRLISD